jgi:hypothetical protein
VTTGATGATPEVQLRPSARLKPGTTLRAGQGNSAHRWRLRLEAVGFPSAWMPRAAGTLASPVRLSGAACRAAVCGSFTLGRQGRIERSKGLAWNRVSRCRRTALHRRRAGALLRRPQCDRGSGTAACLRHTERTDRAHALSAVRSLRGVRGGPAADRASSARRAAGDVETTESAGAPGKNASRRSSPTAQRSSSSVTPPAPRSRRWKRRGGSLRSPERATPFAV